MVDVADSIPLNNTNNNNNNNGNNGKIGSGSDSVGSATKLEELRQLLLDSTSQILSRLGLVKTIIHTIVNSEQMLEKKIFCDAIIDVSKVCNSFAHYRCIHNTNIVIPSWIEIRGISIWKQRLSTGKSTGWMCISFIYSSLVHTIKWFWLFHTFQPKLIAFHNNMDLLIWENCSKISIIEDFVNVSPSLSKMVIVGITLQEVKKVHIQ